MKKNIFIALVFALAIIPMSSCKHRGGHGNPGEGPTYSKLIPIDTANKMIQSYLDGINYTVNTQETKCLIFNADSLRSYLRDQDIKQIKFVFAHTLEYANSPLAHTRPDTNTHNLTMIIAGFNNKGEYVYKNNQVYEDFKGCPNTCPVSGQASSDLLIQ